MATWAVQEAETRLSEVIDAANSDGPQFLGLQGAERAVVLSVKEYRSLSAQRPGARRPDFRSFLLSGPKFDEFELERDGDTGREIDL